ncbi:hypothetical protein C9374_003087 [Naegleria lovaniensis]|uniref:Carbohydrate kinase PfkB domain-containing protein n=1 Tax=Naegleria lovaniensis TaxID=51637 RepID=A0AA88GTE6_NAELO|nr:uncharacterized protein C9374_003087 [Naegleria lovaniensis]KAG2385938.1 hypothetical protein C9374_003087 [Naegleria lovaniensis]
MLNNNAQRRLFSIRDHLLSSRVNQLANAFSSSSTNEQHSSNIVSISGSTSKFSSDQASSFDDYLVKAKIHPDVKDALAQNKPVVALESTIISHGMPYPKNVETAKQVEDQIRKNGAIPATICILDGIIHVGINEQELDRFGKLGQEKKIIKASRRDVALVCSQKSHGATTVSATMLLAHRFGIHVFVTGGIGGVHRVLSTNEVDPMDISTDLTELGRTPTCVVSAGVKSILDIPRTLEYLETQGVTVASYQTDEFPAFFTSKSGCKSHCRLDSPIECAKLISANLQLGLNSGILVAVPIPERLEAKSAQLNRAIEQGLLEAKQKNIKGKDVTPFLLQRINELTQGDSLRANIELILNNARVGAQIAVELSKIQQVNNKYWSSLPIHSVDDTHERHSNEPNASLLSRVASALSSSKREIIVIGGSVMDVTCTPMEGAKLILKTSNPGKIVLSNGGVARNVCEVISRLLYSSLDSTNLPLNFITSVGSDAFGHSLKEHIRKDLRVQQPEKTILVNKNNRTAIYNCLMDETGELVAAVADMSILTDMNTTKHITHTLSYMMKGKRAPLIFLDSNSSVEAMNNIGSIIENTHAELYLDPTSVPKSKHAVLSGLLPLVTFIKPNEHEIFSIVECFLGKTMNKDEMSVEDCLQILLTKAKVRHVLLTQGPQGVKHATLKNGQVTIQSFAALPKRPHLSEPNANVTGCGDNFSGAFIFSRFCGDSIETSIKKGLRASRLALESSKSVSDRLNAQSIEND